MFALKVKLTEEEQERFKSAPTDNLEAYDYFLRGRMSIFRNTQEANAQARRMFERATELDPQYAAAYASLAVTYLRGWIFQWSQDPGNLERAFELAQKAIALDNSVPVAHTVLGLIYVWRDRQHEQATAEAEKAIALDPNYADGYFILTEILNFSGRAEEAIGMVEKAMRLDPHYPAIYSSHLGWAYALAGQYEEAIAAEKRALVLQPDYLHAHVHLAFIYSMLGREEEARAEAAEVLRINPNFSLEVGGQTWPWKDPAVLERWLAVLRKAGLK